MLLKNHLKEVFKKASLENNILLKENIILKWVHRFGLDSLNDLTIQDSTIKEENCEKQNQKSTQLKLAETEEKQEETKDKSNKVKDSSKEEIIIKNKIFNNYKSEYTNPQKLPLPYINNLRKWIKNDNKAS